MKDPLVLPLAAIASGILVSRYALFHPSELILAIGGFLLLGSVSAWRRERPLAGVCWSLALFAAGVLTAVAHAPGPPPVLDATGREIVILGGCVVEPPAVSGDRERFVLELEPGARAQVTLYARENEVLPALRYGQNVELDARVRVPRSFGNPGAFDYARYLSRRDVYWTASGAAGGVRILPGSCGSPIQKALMDLRSAALGRLETLYRGNSYQTGMMQAILIGQSFQLQKVWTEDYRSTGTFHALVISGTHVAVLAAFFLFLLRVCFVPESMALLLTVLAAWLYALVTGWQAPCVRSAAGLTLFMIGGYFYRERRVMNLLAAVGIAFLVFDPEQLFEASFQLTFLAVGFIAAFGAPLLEATSAPLARGLKDLADTGRDLTLAPRVAQFRVEMRLLAETLRVWLRLPRAASTFAVVAMARAAFAIFEIVAISAVIQMGLALPMAVYFHRVGLTGLTANAFVVPLMGLVVPMGFVAVLTGWVWVAKAAGGLLWLSQVVVDWHARLEPNWRIPTPPLWLAVALSAALLAVAVTTGRRRVASATVVAAMLAALFAHPFPADIHAGELEMTAIDVGQGDSILLVFPDGKRVLVDGGGIPAFGRAARSQLDIGEDVVAPYLWSRSIRDVDVLVMTHAHEDHAGGLPALLADFHPKELWVGAVPETASWQALRGQAGRQGARVVPMQAPRRFQFGGAEIEVLSPSAGYAATSEAANGDSLVLRARFGRHSFLLAGDADRDAEWRMLDAGLASPSDVLKVGHHGSRTSSTEEFLSAVKPAFAVISAGFENSYGFPHAAVLERLRRHEAAVLETDRDGLVTIRTDGRRLSVETGRWMEAAPRLLSVF